MLTQLTTLKARLALDPFDATYDTLLTNALNAISARFDQETNRTLARAESTAYEFPAELTRILVPCYPIESVARFEVKVSEAAGWVAIPDVEYVVLRRCIIALEAALPVPSAAPGLAVARVTYTGGYLLPGSPPAAEATALPADLEQAALEQTVFWFQTRDKVGVVRQWPAGGNYEQFADPDLLPSVRRVLARHTRFAV